MKIINRILTYVLAFVVVVSVFSIAPMRRNYLQAMTIPVVTLSNHSPDATSVEYTVTFTTDSAHALSAGDWIEIRDFHIFNMPTPSFSIVNMIQVNGHDAINGSWANSDLQSSDSNDYLVHIKVPSQIISPATSISIVFSSSAGLKNPSLQTAWNANNHFENNPAKDEWRLKLRTNKEGIDVWSSPYSISVPSVSNVSVVVSPNVVNEIASYDISFKTGVSGELHGGSSKIIIEFPSGTVLPNSVPASAVTVKVGNYQGVPRYSIFPSGEIVEITMPNTLYAGDNTTVHVIFSTAAGIHNPPDTSDTYQIRLKTSSEDNFIKSSYYSITPSSVSNVFVSVSPNVVSSTAVYNISFTVSPSGALTKDNSYIFIGFPEGTVIPQTIAPSSISVNKVAVTNCETLANNIVKIEVPVNIAGSLKVTVYFSSLSGIQNPSLVESKYKITVYTTKDPGKAISNIYSIIESHISPASVKVAPNIVKTNASYVIIFSVGSDGALSVGDKIYITFPAGTAMPNDISAPAISVNGTNCTQKPLISGAKVTIFVPQFIPNNSSVLLVFRLSAGIKNPSVPNNNYRLIISTSSEYSAVDSVPFVIKDTVSSSLVITPEQPDGENGYYITQPKVRIVISNPAGLAYSLYYKLDNGTFQKYQINNDILMSEGTHTLYYYAEDSYGNRENTKIKIFKVLLSKPSLTVVAPLNGAKFHTNTIVVKGKTTPGSFLTINETKVSLTDTGSFSYNYTFSKEGTYTIDVKSKNQAGNSSEVKLNITYIKQVRMMLQVGNKHCYLNDEDYYLDAVPYIKNGRVMVPIRFISEAFGFTVRWDPIFRMISIYGGGKQVRLQVGNTIADLFGKAVKLDSAPEIKNGRTFVPLRFISESFGAEVTWDSQLRIVKIIYPSE